MNIDLVKSPRLIVSCRFYFPAGDSRLSHWTVFQCDLDGKINDRWTPEDIDCRIFDWDRRHQRLYYVAETTRNKSTVLEVIRKDSPQSTPKVLQTFRDPIRIESLSLSPDGQHLAVGTDNPAKCRIVDTTHGATVREFDSGDSIQWISSDCLERRRRIGNPELGLEATEAHYLRLGRDQPERVPYVEPIDFPIVDRKGRLKRIVNDFESGGPVRLTLSGVQSKPIPITGDSRWRSRHRVNTIQGLQSGGRRTDGRYDVWTFPHQAPPQLVGAIDPDTAKITYEFSTPGDHLRTAGSPWVLGWPVVRWTKLGKATVAERPLHRMHVQKPDVWTRLWPGPHHCARVILIP